MPPSPSLADLPPLRETIAAHGLMAKKNLGQHFLLDLNLTRRIAAFAGNLQDSIAIEVGPGPGGLTRALVESTNASKIIAIEKDARCIAALNEIAALSHNKLEIIEGDALKLDLRQIAQNRNFAVISNLPYNIGTQLLLNWLKNGGFKSLTLMFQLEVVERLVAAPRTKEYGRLSVITQFCCIAKKVLTLPPRAFTPPPKISSAVVHLTPRPDRPTDIDFSALEAITAAAFGQRRKMLRSSLKPLGGETLLQMAGIDETKRAEDLSVTDYETLARLYSRQKTRSTIEQT